jgi:DNA-binding XRE family transcriptional regulator
MQSASSKTLPHPVRRALKKLGSDLTDARKRRRISTTTMAERAMISRTTLVKVENGDPGVSIGIFATVLFVVGMADRLADIADASHDRVGLDLESEKLPKRISSPRKRSGS